MGAGEAVLDDFEAIRGAGEGVVVQGDTTTFGFGHELKAIAVAAPTSKHDITHLGDVVHGKAAGTRDSSHG